MRQQNLFERASPVLYHYTSAYNALDIIKNNRFQLAISVGSPSEAKLAPPGYNYFISFTRTLTGDYHRWASNGAVMLNIDGTWFNGRYPVKPVDYWERSWLYPDSDRTRESEDRVFAREPEIPANAITQVHIFLHVAQEYRSAQVRQLLITCKQRKIPVFLYDNETAWRLQDTRRSQKITAKLPTLKGIQLPGYTGRSKNYLEDWIELLHKKATKELTKSADKLRYNLRYYAHKNEDNGLTTEISNARKPGAGATRRSAIEILNYMRQHKIKSIIEFKNMIADKWDKIAEIERAAKPPVNESRDVTFRRVDYSDPQVKKMIKDLNRRIFTDELIDTSKDAQAVWWIARAGDQVVGYCAIMPRGKGGYLSRAGVIPDFRGQGLQKQMITLRLRYAQHQGWPWVVTDTHRENMASIHSLEKIGFRPYRPRNPQMPKSWIAQSRFWIYRLT
jgi:ribosomal protein S18 acetylase RimI-like enzyme